MITILTLIHWTIGFLLIVEANFVSTNLRINHVKTAARERRSLSFEPIINYFHVESRVATRFAETTIRGELQNPSDQNAQAEFMLFIPETAFISNYSMVIDEYVYIAEVKSKEQAQSDFDEAVQNNRSAGQIRSHQPATTERGLEAFAIDVNVKAESSVQFQLDYQQLLQRRLGFYENRISIRPNQIVQDLRIDVHMYEPQGIREMTVVEPVMGNNIVSGVSVVDDISDQVKHVVYAPTVNDQMSANMEAGEAGIQDDLIIRYDVNHDDEFGLVQRVDDYFVHFFSPDENNLETLPKNIIFVVDVSGSMNGIKIEQTLQAMLAILDRLEPGDSFMLLLFSDRLMYWPSEQEMVNVHDDTVIAAKNYLREKLVANGGTGINDALVKACQVLQRVQAVRGQNMLIFLTDGRPTTGQTDPTLIIANTEQTAQGNVAIFSLGFGYDLDFELLQKLSYRTGGFAQRIFVDGDDVAVQLETFFRQIALPLMYDVNMVYPTDGVVSNSLTANSFAQFFSGSELVVSGKVARDSPDEWDVRIICTTKEEPVYEISNRIDVTSVDVPPLATNAVTEGFIEKLYVVMKIKDLLKQLIIVDDQDQQAAIKQEALELALEHQLVTPLTSMIIVEADRDDLLAMEDAMPPPRISPGGTPRNNHISHSMSGKGVKVGGVYGVMFGVVVMVLSFV